jgi:hypothetical protein
MLNQSTCFASYSPEFKPQLSKKNQKKPTKQNKTKTTSEAQTQTGTKQEMTV